jgi:hypothetical protein
VSGASVGTHRGRIFRQDDEAIVCGAACSRPSSEETSRRCMRVSANYKNREGSTPWNERRSKRMLNANSTALANASPSSETPHGVTMIG